MKDIMKLHNTGLGGRLGALLRVPFAVAAVALPLAGCDIESLLDVDDPDIVNPGQFTDETALPAIRAGALGDFGVAFSGASFTEGQVLTSGLLADEWFHSGTFPTRSQIDIRRIDIDNGTLQGTTRNLYRARSAAEAAARLFGEFGPNTAGHAEMLSLAGYSYINFGENYCSGVPFSLLTEDGSFEYGGQETTENIFGGDDRALGRFDDAIAAATAAGSATQLNLASVGKGRALLNLGRYDEAAAAVADVPTDFAYVILHSDNTGREQNGIFVFNWIVERWSVANSEGENGLPYRDAADAGDPRLGYRRVPANDVGFDRRTPQFDNLKYTSRGDPVTLADGIEARLIEAEAALDANDVGTFLAKINETRAALGVADDAVDPGPAGRVDLLFQERAYSLWLTGHRLGDLRRLIRQYDRPADEVFPIGDYHKGVLGGVYGDDVNLPISVDERNNPEFSAFPEGDLCLNRDA
jgi:hypothetical protein